MAARADARYTISAEDRTQRAFRSVNRSLTAVTRRFVAFGASFVAFGTITRTIQRTLDTANRLENFAAQIGTTSEELARLEFIGGRFALTAQQVDTGLQRLVRRTQEATQGNKAYRQAFAELNIDVEQFAALPLEQKIFQLAGAFSQVEDQQRLAFKLFDTEGVAFLRFLSQGEDAVRRLSERADELGASNLARAADEADRFKSAMQDADLAIQSFTAVMIDKWAPLIETFTSVTNRFREGVESVQGAIGFTPGPLGAVTSPLGILQPLVNRLLGRGGGGGKSEEKQELEAQTTVLKEIKGTLVSSSGTVAVFR